MEKKSCPICLFWWCDGVHDGYMRALDKIRQEEMKKNWSTQTQLEKETA